MLRVRQGVQTETAFRGLDKKKGGQPSNRSKICDRGRLWRKLKEIWADTRDDASLKPETRLRRRYIPPRDVQPDHEVVYHFHQRPLSPPRAKTSTI